MINRNDDNGLEEIKKLKERIEELEKEVKDLKYDIDKDKEPIFGGMSSEPW